MGSVARSRRSILGTSASLHATGVRPPPAQKERLRDRADLTAPSDFGHNGAVRVGGLRAALALSAAAGIATAATAIGPMPAAVAAVPVAVIDGKGWGHGVGMAQDGAFWMAKAGANTGQ